MLQSSAALRSVLADPNLSLAAKGALVFVLAQPSGRVVTRAELVASTRDPLGEIDAAIRELVRGGYLATARPKHRRQHTTTRREEAAHVLIPHLRKGATVSTVLLTSSPDEAGHDPTMTMLHAALGQLRQRFGPAVAGSADGAPPVAAIPTGSLALDLAIGVGGIPRGRITEVYGPDGAGKTTLALSVIAQAQRAGGTGCFIDAEHALDLGWAERVGVDLGRLVLCRPEHGEQALQVAETLIRSGAIDVLVVDSIAALVPRAELAGEVGERHAGEQANLLSQALRKLCGPIARSGTAVVVTNQLRQRAGTPGMPVYTSGGRALGYYASLRLDLRQVGHVRDGGQVLGSRVRVQVTKSKVAPAWQTAELAVMADCGVLAVSGAEHDAA